MAYTDIDDPSAHFQSYAFSKSTGTGSATFDGNSDLQPDLLWVKPRGADGHELWDSTRGINSTLFPHASEAQDTASNRLTSFDSDGFSWGNAGNLNAAGNFVSWAWKANGGSTSSNTSGSITSTVQANTTAGISVVKYTGTGSNATVGHGLGQKPSWIIVKRYSAAGTWYNAHEGLNNFATDVFYGQVNFAAGAEADAWNSTAPTASVFSVGTNAATNSSGESHIAYAFAEKPGFSKFGRAYGNGLTRGVHIHCGFKPRFVYWRNISRNGDGAGWLRDTARRGFDDQWYYENLSWNSSGAETTETTAGKVFEVRANGFVIRSQVQESWNWNDDVYIYCAFAENPFVTSSGAPTTAK
jgi:hypothetical protein